MTKTGNKIIMLPRDGDRDVAFFGERIGEASSSPNNADPNFESTGRWTEITIYKTKGGEYYVVYEVGRTQWQGEHDRHSVTMCDTEDQVIDALRRNGWLSWLAKRVLDDARIECVEML